MSHTVILVDQKEDFQGQTAGRTIMDVRDYLAGDLPAFRQTVRIINLSRDYRYLGYGYYASLLAAARGHKVVPTAAALVDMAQQGRQSASLQALDKTLSATLKRLKEQPGAPFSVTAFFGRPDDSRFAKLAAQAFDLFRCPIMRLRIRLDAHGRWCVHAIKPLAINELSEEMREVFWGALDSYTKVEWRPRKTPKTPKWSIAMLCDPKEVMPPSNPAALKKFVRVGEDLGLAVEPVTKKDFNRLTEFDALFIRETTAIDHHTFRFARKAQDEGMPVIDDPLSIIRCTNKVYLAELLHAHRIPTPRTFITGRRRLKQMEHMLPYPMVLKIPDGSFSRGVVKVADREELTAKAHALFEDSDLILAQEFMPTEFDWRVGVLNGEPLFVCQYLMADHHWQIYNHHDGRSECGGFRTLSVEETPHHIIDVAVRAAALMGNGLYGVDLKQSDRGVFVIEINDNPNIDAGIEDAKLHDEVYRRVLKEFIRRLENR